MSDKNIQRILFTVFTVFFFLNLSGQLVELPFHLNFNIDYRRVGKQFINDANTKEYKQYQLVHAKLKYEYKDPDRIFGFKIYTEVKNIFDLKHASMILVNAPSFGGRAPRYYYPGLPRMIFFGVSVEV